MPVTTLQAIVYSSPNGLIPYLEATLGDQWSTFQLQRASGLLQGFRITSDSFEPSGKYTTTGIETRSLIVGFMVTLNNSDPLLSQCQAADFQEDIDRAILTWASTKAVNLLCADISRIDGTIDFKPVTGRTGAWVVTAIRQFDISYLT